MPARPSLPPESESCTEEWLTSMFGAADPRDAAAELRPVLRRASKADRARAVERLAALARAASIAYQRSGIEILLALLDTAADELGTGDGRFTAADERGRYELAAGRPQRCLAQLAKAEEYASTPDRRCHVHYNSGLAWLWVGNSIEAESHLGEALRLATNLDDVEGVVQSTNLLAHLAAQRNEPREAEGLLEVARRKAEEAGRDDLVAYLTMMYGVMYARTGEFAAAHQEYRRLSELSGAADSATDPGIIPRAEAAAISGRIMLHLRQGEAAAAVELAPRLRALLEQQHLGERISDLITLSQVQMLSSDLSGSLRDCREALRMADEHELRFERAHALSELALAYALSGAFEPAHRSCVAALEITEDLRPSVGDVSSRLAFAADRSAIYEFAVQLCLVLAELKDDPAYRAEALSWVERVKSRTLSEMLSLRSLPAPPYVPAALLATERELLERIREYESAGTRSRKAYADIWRQLEATWRAIAAIAPEYVALRRGRTVQPDQIRHMLRHSATGAAPSIRRPGRMRQAARTDGESPGARYARPREVELTLPGGGTARVQIMAERDAASRRQVLARLTAPGPVPDRLRAAVRDLAIVDATWWSMFDSAAESGAVPDAMQLGRLLCGCVAAWGEAIQVRAASGWWSPHLVARACHALANLPVDDTIWEATRSVLAGDRPASEVCHELHERRVLPPLTELDDLLASEADWLDAQFFQNLADQIRAAAGDGRVDVATMRFLAGIRAATVVAGTRQDRLAEAEAFIDRFPEYRFSMSCGRG
jgi:tetratricopeptide (TPR) repeat protein